MERVKLIWDFRGPNAAPIAQHHAKHLGEFAEAEKLEHSITGTEQAGPMHHIAFLVVEKNLTDTLRDRLRPNRGQVFE